MSKDGQPASADPRITVSLARSIGAFPADEWDALTQQFWSHHYQREPDGRYRRTSAPFRYAWPAELDLMARMAGLQLVERWADWDRSEFTASSRRHVSVWQTAS